MTDESQHLPDDDAYQRGWLMTRPRKEYTMNTWQEHIEAAEQALSDAGRTAQAEPAYVARDLALVHLDIARFLRAIETTDA